MVLNNATVPLNLDFHIRNIINSYMGQTVKHIKKTKEIDLQGNIISESSTESDVIGIISPVKQDVINESIGMIKSGDLLFYAMADEEIIVGEQITETSIRMDIIEYQGVQYKVSQKQLTGYDPGVPGVAVVSKYILRKIAYE